LGENALAEEEIHQEKASTGKNPLTMASGITIDKENHAAKGKRDIIEKRGLSGGNPNFSRGKEGTEGE